MSAIQLGISRTEYEEMTPYELNLHAKIYMKVRKEEEEQKIVLTYLGASWQRAKKMPSLKSILNKTEPKKKKMSENDIFEEIKRLNEAFGGDVY